MLTLGSLFDGIGGWQLAAVHNGVTPIWASEIEAFPCAVKKKHFPETLQLGDITKLDGAKLPPVDIICAGSPCQNLSVAGNREGLKGEQSSLFMDAIRIVRRMRFATEGRYPRFFVWENVPGAFSSNRGADFRAVLEEIGQTYLPMPRNNKWANAGLVELPKCQIAWRVLDAQHAVPQRRKRIFLVADFAAERRCAGEILLISESVSRDSSESREAREGPSAGTESGIGGASVVRMRAGCAGGGKGALVSREKSLPLLNHNEQVLFTSATLGAKMSGTEPTVAVYDMTHADEVMRRVRDGRSPTLNARMGTGGNQVPVVSYSIAGNTIERKDKNGANGKGVLEEKSYTLNTIDRHAVAAFREGSFGQYEKTDVAATTKAVGGVLGGGSETFVYQKSVRRLTPTECERLQGLPDGYTLIDDKTCSDTARYKALGNGMAQPCADYVMRRIVEACGLDDALKEARK